MGQNPKTTLIAEDLSAVGNLSLHVALPILTAFNQQLITLPTALLSTQTETFGTPVKADLTTWLPETLNHFNEQKISFDQALIGYLGSSDSCCLLQQVLTDSTEPVIFDPVMGDDDALYPGLDADYPQKMQQLLHKANVTVPNITEAQLLTNTTVNTYPRKQQKLNLLTQLETMMRNDAHAVITDVKVDDLIGCTWLEDGEVTYYGRPRLADHFYGSGDVFAALLTGFMTVQSDFSTAVRLATDYTYSALKDTENSEIPRNFGMQIGPLLGRITAYVHKTTS
jgi:pyridoxine kinase